MPVREDDAFLDRLRSQGDLEADGCFDQISRSGQSFGGLFEFLNSNSAIVPDFAPAPIRSYFAACQRVPTPDGSPPDMKRLERGEAAFLRHACCSALVLLANSLPAGYAAPNLAQVLVISGNLKNHPYRRLLGVLQMVVNVTSRNGFAPDGKAVVTAAKLRLLHAGVRHIARQRLPDYDSRYGVRTVTLVPTGNRPAGNRKSIGAPAGPRSSSCRPADIRAANS